MWYFNGDFNYTVAHPEMWLVTELDASIVSITSNVTGPKLDLGVDEVPLGIDAQTYAEQLKPRAEAVGATIVGESAIVVNGLKGYELLLTIPGAGATTKQRAAIFVVDGTGYFVVCSAMESQFDTYKPTFDAIMRTFYLTDEPLD